MMEKYFMSITMMKILRWYQGYSTKHTSTDTPLKQKLLQTLNSICYDIGKEKNTHEKHTPTTHRELYIFKYLYY